MSPPIAVHSTLGVEPRTHELPIPKIAPVYKEVVDDGPKAFDINVEEKRAAYPHYLPVWIDKKYPPLEPYTHVDAGSRADRALPNLFPELRKAEFSSKDLTSSLGSEVRGIQLSQLSDAAKDELALFVAKKKVVVFRDQDFANLPIQEAVNYAKHFGRLHIHPTTGHPKGFPEVHLVHRSEGDVSSLSYLKNRTNSCTWHSDVTYEAQPPATTFLYLLEGPDVGGDTLFANQVDAYRRLSPEFRRRLHGLKAAHSGFEQADSARRQGSLVRREPVVHVHPIVRTHPVTGEKALYVNPQFTRYIVGLKQEESDLLLKFLYDHIALGQDFQVRVKWEKGTVVVWDNRVTAHSALVDWHNGHRRHLGRLTPQGEAPFETPFDEHEEYHATVDEFVN